MYQPDISVVIVSYYAAGAAKSLNDLRGTLTALTQQDATVNAEWLLCENNACAKSMPDDFSRILPNLKRVLSGAKGSYELKNAWVRAATSNIVAILDADCLPAMKAMPKVAVISGRTIYPAGGLTERILTLLSRSYVDRGVSGPTWFISNNNSI